MDAGLLIRKFREEVAGVKAMGRKTVRVVALERYLDVLEAEVSSSGEIDDGAWEAAERAADREDWRAATMARVESSGRAGQAALNTAIMINGGASVAVLAFMGSVVPLGVSAAAFASALTVFCVGVFCGAAATGLVYLAEINYFSREKLAGILNKASIATVSASYLLFVIGGVAAGVALRSGATP